MNLNEFRIAIDLLGFKPMNPVNLTTFGFRIVLSPQVSFGISMSESEIFGIVIRIAGDTTKYTDPKQALKNIVKRIKVEKLRAGRVDEIMSHLPQHQASSINNIE